MLSDPVEIEIISRARQKNVRNHQRSRQPFVRVFKNFLSHKDLRGKRLLDLGPGQYDFGVMARVRGAETLGLDHDAAVLELGRYKRFEVREYKLQLLDARDFDQRFDGIFCKFSWNAFWFHEDDDHHYEAVGAIGALLKPDGWGWIAPWNGVPKSAELEESRVVEVLALQARFFRDIGFDGFELDDRLARRYGVHGDVANNVLFVRNVDVPRAARARPLG